MKNLIIFLLLPVTLFSYLATASVFSADGKAQPALITHRGKPLFMSGMNLAWINFAKDMDNFNEVKFRMALDQVSLAGGNTLRWWIHVNGSQSPVFTDGLVSGLSPRTIPTLKKALDMAWERGVGLILTLWSFDMLQKQDQDIYAAKALIEDKKCTRSYIKNALIPMVRALKGHPALIAWDICNEPEGMLVSYGWAYGRTEMKYFQRFTNLVAGAIHREDKNAKVTVGSWNVMVVTDINGLTNYYRDDRLIKAGGDKLGTLDFYQIHFYGEHFDEMTSPFHHPASYWKLDKPILIGEFPAKGLYNFGKGYRPKTTLTIEECYQYALENGYAGALAWTWTNHDGFGGVDDATPGMKKVLEIAPHLVSFGDLNKVPAVIKLLSNITVDMNSAPVENFADLKTVFYDYEDGTNLTYALKNGNPELIEAAVDSSGMLGFNVKPDKAGSAEITVIATDSGGKSSQANFTIFVPDPAKDNMALGKPVTASSIEKEEVGEKFVNDGDPLTRWSSAWMNNEWICIDLLKVRKISRVRLIWETAFGKGYRLEVSNDQVEWTKVFEQTDGKGGSEEITFDPVQARYIRMFGFDKSTQWGFSLWEFEVYAEK